MDYTQSFAISAAGMNVERTRVDVAALNLANANTAQGVNGSSYQPLRVIAEPGGQLDVSAGENATDFGALVNQGLAPRVHVVPTNAPPRLVYEPSHPLANERGFVAYAGVDSATEMVSMMSATRAYEANVSAMNTARTLAMRALDIGSSS